MADAAVSEVFGVDTNILVYAHFESYPQHKKARAFCEAKLLRGGDWCLGWQIYYEYLRIVTHPRLHRRPLTLAQATADLDPYLRSDRCHVLVHSPQHGEIFAALAREFPGASGNLVHDCHYAALLREHGVDTLYTADGDFKRFGFLDVIDPTS